MLLLNIKTDQRGNTAYPIGDRLQKLKYDFVNGDINRAMSTALRFTLSVLVFIRLLLAPLSRGVIAKTPKYCLMDFYQKNNFDAIRAQWQSKAESDWVGQV